MKIKLEQNANGEWRWYYGVATYGHAGNSVNWRLGDDKIFATREEALNAAKEYIEYIKRLTNGNKVIHSEELEL